MQALVTGCAGFIGSHLTEALLARGDKVRGVDAFTDYYDPAAKHANLDAVASNPSFELVEDDLQTCDIRQLLDGIDVVFHEAGQPGVRLSWDAGFPAYVGHNVLATQRLLEAVRDVAVERLVYASSSSVYGDAPRYPTTEDDLPRPRSPYGVTKLSAEHLCNLYAAQWGIPCTSLRYFSVYGPRQRPDMGLARFFASVLADEPLTVFGDGEQIRDFTFVGDVVAATLAAAEAATPPGTVCNIAGGSSTTVTNLLRLIESLVGRQLQVVNLPEQAGDVRQTGGTIDRAKALLDWQPEVGLEEGCKRQLDWILQDPRMVS